MKKLFVSYVVASAAAIVYLFLQVEKLKAPDILRTRGIIVMDSAGRDRILIGAPFPYSEDRVRTDTAQVRRHWASRYEADQYMAWYRDFHHGGNGILVLNESGFDKILLGDDLADPNTGRRIAEPTGLLWNDDNGFERGGLGLNRLKENGRYRNMLGFDDETGEALHIGLFEDGTKMIRFAWADSVLLLGRGTPGNFLFEEPKPFVGIQVKSAQNKTGYRVNWVGRTGQ